MSEVGPEYTRSAQKRTLDIVGGALLAAATFPVAVGAATASALEHGTANTFFYQKRRNDRLSHFVVAKFRTFGVGNDMDVPVPPLFQDYLDHGMYDPGWLTSLQSQDRWEEFNDSAANQHSLIIDRASRLGNLMRVSGVDELRQLYSVISGQESLVGARSQIDPVLASRLVADPVLFDEWFTGPYSAKKGLVGAGSNWYHRNAPRGICTPRDVIRTVMSLDIAYYENASLSGDLRLLAEAPVNILAGLGHHLLRHRSHIEHGQLPVQQAT